MSSEKKLTLKRLLIFLVISFLPFYIIIPAMWSYYGEPVFASEREDIAAAVYCLGVTGMLIPSIAHLLTRLITKEGFRNTYLGWTFGKHPGWYLASVWVKLLESVLITVVVFTVLVKDIPAGDILASDNANTRTAMLLIQLASSIILFMPAFGEEWGWRGYMMPKLTELMGKPAAVIAGGIIWGVWHAPLTVAGHNFGVGYDGYPWLGIALMCLMCVGMNAFLTLLTEKTGSIYPAAFCHSVNNNLSSGVLVSLLGSEAAIEGYSGLSMLSSFMPYIPVILVTGAVSMVLLMRNRKGAAAR